MAFKLDKQEKKVRDQHVEDLNESFAKLEDAVNVFNAGLAALKSPVEEALAAYNLIVAEARGFAEDIANRADSEISDKSDKWQGGDRGQEASSWKDEWENASLDDVEIEFPDDLELGDISHADTLEQLPEEMG